MKKLLCVLLSMMMLMGSMSLTAFAEGTDEAAVPEGTETEAAEEIVYPDELKVGSVTEMKGDFFTEMFGNNTADIDVRALIHGYNLVNWDQNQGTYILDPSVVTDVLVTADDAGNKTYTLVLADDLMYSDGTPITAWDYAFSILLMMSPEIEEIGGKIYRNEHILGSANYVAGRRKAMAGEEVPPEEASLGGVSVISDHQLAITLDHEFLPYFFEVGLLLTVPYPISVIAPGCKVYDDGYGIYIGNEDQGGEPLYTADLLRKTILDPETGYNSHPSVVSGPYTLTGFDGTTATFELNPYFKGAVYMRHELPVGYEQMGVVYEPLLDAEGNQLMNSTGELGVYLVKPVIEKISFTKAEYETMLQELDEGNLHLINKLTHGETILELMNHASEAYTSAADDGEEEEDSLFVDEDKEGAPDANATEEGEEAEEASYRMQAYPRVGLSFLTFTYERPAVHDMEVRQALAWLMDRDAMATEYTSGFGQTVEGYYGIAQWEYLVCMAEDDDDGISFPIVRLMDLEEKPTAEELEEMRKHPNMYAETEAQYEEMYAAWASLSLDQLVKYNIYDIENDPERTTKVGLEKAIALLNDAGWTLNRSGEAYDPAKDDVRCKEIDGELVALDLSIMYPEGNKMADLMETHFIEYAAEAGIKITLVPEKMTELLKSYYREAERTTDMIYLATNFHVVVDPSITYSTDPTPNHLVWNNTYSDDEDLYYRAVAMRQTDPMDVYEYVAKWISFQERYNEVLPCIPIYSNTYFDFYSSQLQNYKIMEHVTWSQAIMESYFGEDIIPEETEGEEGGDTLF